MLCAIGFALPSLRYPFGMDQPIHWYAGKGWLEGYMPYATAVSTKPPAVFLVHTASIAVLGDHQWSVRVVDILNMLLASALIATFRPRWPLQNGRARAIRPRAAGELGAACLMMACILYAFFDWTSLGHPDAWQGTLMMMLAWVVVRAPGGEVGPRRAFFAGVVAGLSLGFKHVAIVSAVIFGAAAVLMARRDEPISGALRNAIAYVAGLCAVLVALAAPFYLTGTFGPLREMMVDHIQRYAEHATGDPLRDLGWLGPGHGLAPALLGVALTALGIARAVRRGDRRDRWVGIAILAVVVSALVTVALQRRGFQAHSYGYQFLVLAPALALGIAWGLRRLMPGRGGRQLAVAALLSLVSLALEPEWLSTPGHHYRAEWRAFAAVLAGRLDHENALDPYVGHQRTIDNYRRQLAAARRIDARKRPGDTLCVDGFIGALYQLTGLRCTSRFMVSVPFLRSASPRWRAEYQRMWDTRPPTFFVSFSDRVVLAEQMRARGYRAEVIDDGLEPSFVLFERRPRP